MVVRDSSRKGSTFSGTFDASGKAKGEQGKKVKLPDKYLCVQCHKWKSTPQYSNNQLQSYQWKTVGQNKVNGVTARLTCRVCIGEQLTELLCQGTCGMYKSLNEFSKSQRRQPETAWCSTCIQWREACEPDVSVQAHPNAILSTEEEQELAGFSIGAADLEGGYSDSEDGFDDEYTYSSMAALSISGNQGKASSSASAVGFGTAKKPISGSTTSVSNPYSSLSEYSGDTGEDQTLKLPHAGYNTEQTSSRGWSVVDAKRNPQKAGIAYNAYDSAGNLHSRVREPSTTGSTSNNPSTNSGNEGTRNYRVGHSGWAKPATRKTPMPSFPAISRPQGRRNGYDDDESADEM